MRALVYGYVCVCLCCFVHLHPCSMRLHFPRRSDGGAGGVPSPLMATMQAVIEMQEGKRSPNLTLFPAAAAAAAGRETRRQKAEKKGASPAIMKLFDGNKSGF